MDGKKPVATAMAGSAGALVEWNAHVHRTGVTLPDFWKFVSKGMAAQNLKPETGNRKLE